MDAHEPAQPSASSVWCPRAALLEHWAGRDWTNGLTLDDAGFGPLYVRTRNSTYEIIVLCRQTRAVLVRGGRFFPEFTRAVLAGSSLGGSFLKIGGIYVGLRLELYHDRQRVVTSPIVSIRTESDPVSVRSLN